MLARTSIISRNWPTIWKRKCYSMISIILKLWWTWWISNLGNWRKSTRSVN